MTNISISRNENHQSHDQTLWKTSERQWVTRTNALPAFIALYVSYASAGVKSQIICPKLFKDNAQRAFI